MNNKKNEIIEVNETFNNVLNHKGIPIVYLTEHDKNFLIQCINKSASQPGLWLLPFFLKF